MRAEALVLAGLSLAAFADGAGAFADGASAVTEGPVGIQNDVVFSEYSQLSSAGEIIHRMMSPLQGARLIQASERTKAALQGQAVDLAKEHFALYVPPQVPADGYALFVFVSPSDEAKVPLAWTSIFDRRGLIFVTAEHSGNDQNVFDRREPLAIIAASNVMSRYRVDPARVYVGGFSGGARVAQRLALGYPDLFHGVLLDAGSDPLGDAHLPLPAAELFAQFQQSRVIFVTGAEDSYHVTEDIQSKKSLADWCVFSVFSMTVPWIGHQMPSSSAFERLLDALMAREPVDADKLAACRQHIDQELEAALGDAQALMQAGKRDQAQRALQKIDARFGGLAAPRSVEWTAALAR
jgi:predicted esterase